MTQITIPVHGELTLTLDLGGNAIPLVFNQHIPDEQIRMAPVGPLLEKAKGVKKYEYKNKAKPRSRNHPITDETKAKIIELRGQGLSLRAIERQVGVSMSSVGKILRGTGLTKPIPKSTDWAAADKAFLLENFKKDKASVAEALGRTLKACEVMYARIKRGAEKI